MTNGQVELFRIPQAVRPSATVVELCKSRSAVMWSGGESSPESSAIGASTVSGSSAVSSTSAISGASSSKASSEVGSPSATGGQWPRPASLTNVLQLSGGGGGSDEGGGFLSTMQRSLQLGGQSALLLRVLLSNLAGAAAGPTWHFDPFYSMSYSMFKLMGLSLQCNCCLPLPPTQQTSLVSRAAVNLSLHGRQQRRWAPRSSLVTDPSRSPWRGLGRPSPGAGGRSCVGSWHWLG